MGALLALINPIASIIDRVIPDKSAAATAKAQLLETEVQGELNTAIGQIQTNTAEAANQSVFVAGWRPFVGWACGAAFVYAFILQPSLQTFAVILHSKIDVTQLPKLDLSTMMPVLLGMLGLGAMRSFDKTQGTSNGQ